MLFFVVPAYNEEANIGRLIEELHTRLQSLSLPYRLIVVDDGSRDATASIVEEKTRQFPVSLISYQPNRGVDEAFRRGLDRALEEALDEDVILTLEADGTADLGLLPQFLGNIRQGCGLVVASYYAEGGGLEGTALHRKVLSWGANALIRFTLGLKGVKTFSSFYRAYRPKALKTVRSRYGGYYQTRGFACVVELLFRIHRSGFSLAEVPMVLRGSRRVGKSKMKVLQTIAGYLRLVLRYAFR